MGKTLSSRFTINFQLNVLEAVANIRSKNMVCADFEVFRTCGKRVV
jgi:hypothetical protein